MMYRFLLLFSTVGFSLLSLANNPIKKEDNTAGEKASFTTFESVINGERIDLTWETINENKVAFFTIEKSKDGILFETMCKVSASEKWSAYMNYFNTDFNVWEGKTYYKIKQNDVDGNVLSSSTVAVVYNGQGGQNMEHQPVVVTENSFEDLLNLSADTEKSSDETLVVLRNRKGDELFSKVVVSRQNGDYYTASDYHNIIPEGKYLVVGSSNNQLFGKKILIR